MKNVLITGGAGFIGSNLVEYLLERNYNVRVVDSLFAGSKDNLKDFLSDIEFYENDIRDLTAMISHCRDIDGIVHLAAISSVALSIEEPIMCNDVNISATINLLNIARNQGVKKFVFASSSAIYGNPDTDKPVSEDLKPDPLTPYAVSKLTSEMYCDIYTKIYNLPSVALRLFNVYGVKQNAKSEYSAVIPKFIDALNNLSSPTIFGDGEQTRDFVYVKDVISAMELALTTDTTGIFNIASGNSYSVNELAELIKKLLNKDINVSYEPERTGEVKFSQADITLAKEKLGFVPKYALSDGIKDKLQSLNLPVSV
ncbi:MAG: GDP-mannose 4,6-dehydratase [Vampirovibrionia bacterium]